MTGEEPYDQIIRRPLTLRFRKKRSRRPRQREQVARELQSISHRLFHVAEAGGLLHAVPERDPVTNALESRSTALIAFPDVDKQTTIPRDNLDLAVGKGGAPPSDLESDHEANTPQTPGDSRVEAGRDEPTDMRTDAERQFDAVTSKRERERLEALAMLTNKEQVERFNAKLAQQPEHFDLFKVSHTK